MANMATGNSGKNEEILGLRITNFIVRGVDNNLRLSAKKAAKEPGVKASAEVYGYIRWMLKRFGAERSEIDALKNKWLSGMSLPFQSEFNKLAAKTKMEMEIKSMSVLETSANQYAYLRYKMRDTEGTPKGKEEKKKLKTSFVSNLSEDEKKAFYEIAQDVYQILITVSISELMKEEEMTEEVVQQA